MALVIIFDPIFPSVLNRMKPKKAAETNFWMKCKCIRNLLMGTFNGLAISFMLLFIIFHKLLLVTIKIPYLNMENGGNVNKFLARDWIGFGSGVWVPRNENEWEISSSHIRPEVIANGISIFFLYFRLQSDFFALHRRPCANLASLQICCVHWMKQCRGTKMDCGKCCSVMPLEKPN